MNRRRRTFIRPSRGTSAVSFVMGIVFIIVGVCFLIPSTIMSGVFPAVIFGFAWTGIAAYITISHGLYLFGKRKAPWMNGVEIVTEEEAGPADGGGQGSAEERLKQLQALYDQRLITTEEFEEKRKEILKEI